MVILKAFTLMACPLKGNKPSQKQNKHTFSPQDFMLLTDFFSYKPHIYFSFSPKEGCVFCEALAVALVSEWLPWFSSFGHVNMWIIITESLPPPLSQSQVAVILRPICIQLQQQKTHHTAQADPMDLRPVVQWLTSRDRTLGLHGFPLSSLYLAPHGYHLGTTAPAIMFMFSMKDVNRYCTNTTGFFNKRANMP